MVGEQKSPMKTMSINGSPVFVQEPQTPSSRHVPRLARLALRALPSDLATELVHQLGVSVQPATGEASHWTWAPSTSDAFMDISFQGCMSPNLVLFRFSRSQEKLRPCYGEGCKFAR